MNSFHSLPLRLKRTAGRRSSGRMSVRDVATGSAGGSVSGPKITGRRGGRVHFSGGKTKKG